MPYYKHRRKRAASTIQRNYRRHRYRKRGPYRTTRSTGILKCIQSFSRVEPIAAQPLPAGSFTAAQEVYSLDQVAVAN